MTIDTTAYRDFKNERQSMFDRVFGEYGFAAFSDEQFKDGIEKLHEHGYSGFKLKSLGCGAFIMAEHAKDITAGEQESAKQLRELMSDYDFALSAF